MVPKLDPGFAVVANAQVVEKTPNPGITRKSGCPTATSRGTGPVVLGQVEYLPDGASDGSQAGVIDIGKALHLLETAVNECGPDFVYSPVWIPESRYLTCLYADRGAAHCIVGRALSLAGVCIHDLEAMRDHGVRELYEQARFPVALTLGAVAVLDAAQQRQDRGCTWGDVLDYATTTALRFLDLLPDKAFDLSTDDR